MPPEDLTSAPRNPKVTATLISGLSAYGRLYGLPNSPEQVQGLLSTLLRLYLPEEPAALIDAVAQQVLDGLTADDLKNAIVDRATSALAKETHRWQQHLAQQAQGILAAYMQRYTPHLTPEDFRTIVTAVMPLLSRAIADHRPLTRSEALGLISQIVQSFDVNGAIAAAIDPAYLAIAETLATALAQRPMAEAVGETVTAYVKSYAPNLINIGANLIAAALSAVLKNQVDFNIDTQLSVIDEKLLIEQVSFQLNILQQSPPPSKAAWAIADQVNTAVEQYRQARKREGSVDVTAGLVSEDGLSISSPLTSTRQLGDRPPTGSPALG
ncbi:MULTISPECIES: hypothetical protein [Cyanophyceae]|uniref:hypothetical protein n=1 Tax=Cyanophyceae TaxID=3028117 RepID=UPI00168562A7|nr:MULTISPECIES: hypothetical protein [Cyanophyceae]MBD1918795.1 hypothetical protein [Phormidium sp. FACHB-77]MBD2033362.1 hypothetical protein [Phormidium sp. FACHB-322]MBD2053705.1 hypothetical protein [Leptolyngbya sp. FACHB-60]